MVVTIFHRYPHADHFSSLSLDAEVFPYQFEPDPSPEPSLVVSLVTHSEDEPSSRMSTKNCELLCV